MTTTKESLATRLNQLITNEKAHCAAISAQGAELAKKIDVMRDELLHGDSNKVDTDEWNDTWNDFRGTMRQTDTLRDVILKLEELAEGMPIDIIYHN